jgi:hypothetical protein
VSAAQDRADSMACNSVEVSAMAGTAFCLSSWYASQLVARDSFTGNRSWGPNSVVSRWHSKHPSKIAACSSENPSRETSSTVSVDEPTKCTDGTLHSDPRFPGFGGQLQATRRELSSPGDPGWGDLAPGPTGCVTALTLESLEQAPAAIGIPARAPSMNPLLLGGLSVVPDGPARRRSRHALYHPMRTRGMRPIRSRSGPRV